MKKTVLVLALALFATTTTSSFAADAKENYEKLCAKCHGSDGKGDTKMGKKGGVKDLSDAKIQDSFKDEEAFKAVKEGKKEKDTDKTLMKPFPDLSDDEIKALVAYVRTLKAK